MQSAFTSALLTPALPTPDGLTDPQGRSADRRFAVYRNNVASSLTRVLEAGFPAIRKLVGEEFFAAMAGEFLRNHPPRTRIMMLYGAEFPDFLAQFPPVRHLGYLPDVARLEQALRGSYHAADHAPVLAESLTTLSPDRLLAARLTLAPSVALIRSVWPIHAIWQANMRGGPAPVAVAQDVVILRAGFDPEPHLLPQGGAAFLTALMHGQPLGAAADLAGEGFDLSALLVLLLTQGALAGVSE